MLNLDDFCAGPFWDDNLTINNNSPDFTPCFESTVLSWTPVGFFLILSPLLLHQLRSSSTAFLPWKPLLITKLVLSVCIVLVSSLTVVGTLVSYDGAHSSDDESTADMVSSVLNWILTIFIMISLGYCRKKGLNSSGVIFVTLLLLAICGLFEFRTRIMHFNREGAPRSASYVFLFICHVINYPLVIALLFLSCFADEPNEETYKDKTHPCPEVFASFLNRTTFAYFLPCAITGYRRALDYKDLWSLETKNSSVTLAAKWSKFWDPKARKYQETVKDAIKQFDEQKSRAMNDKDFETSLPRNYGSISSAINGNAVENDGPRTPLMTTKSPLLSNTSTKPNASQPKLKLPTQPSMAVTMFQCVWPMFIPAVAVNLIADVLQFLSPQLLNYIISFIQDQEEPGWHGYIFAIGILASSILNTLFNQAMFHLMFTISAQIKAYLTDAIYQKTLRLSNASKRGYTTGEIVNRMSVDAQRFTWEVPFLTTFISCPFQIVLATYFLYQQLGPSIFAGIGVLVLSFPVNSIIFHGLETNQVKQMAIKDERLKMLTETLNSLKVLKLYAWEPSFETQISQIRQREVKTLRNVENYDAGFQFMWEAAPFLMTAVSFMTYVLSDPVNNVLTPQVAFVSLSLFNLLTFPMGVLPIMMAAMVQLSVSNKRIREFLLADEIDPKGIRRLPKPRNEKNGSDSGGNDPSPAIEIQNGTFSWASCTAAEALKEKEDSAEEEVDGEKKKISTRPVLTNINIQIKPNSLTAIVGKVGEGKSSLISAMLGEMNLNSGEVTLRGSVAYVPQQAWIQNMSIKNNITFSRKYDSKFYEKVISTCALQPDFDILPGGDATEIGEKGINLSGGQKQRVSLARAVYQRADINLFDDPLSAVDAHVGRHIFDKVIGPEGLLKDSTRVLVTHGLTYLKEADQIIVIKQGQVSEIGSYDELVEAGGAFSEVLNTFLDSSDEEVPKEDDFKENILNRSISLQATSGKDTSSRSPFKSESKSGRTRNTSVSSPIPVTPTRTTFEGEMSPRYTASLLRLSTLSDGEIGLSKDSVIVDEVSPLPLSRRSESKKQDDIERQISLLSAGQSTGHTRLIEEETAATGRVKAKVFLAYFKAVGYAACSVIGIGYIVANSLKAGSTVWLSAWSDDTAANISELPSNTSGERPVSVGERLGVYTALGVGYSILILTTALATNWFTIKASVSLHRDMLHSLLRAPMALFDVTPLGRIINRFGKDVDTMDYQLPESFRECLRVTTLCLANVVVIIVVTPIFAVVIVPLAVVYYIIQRIYIASSRQIKRMESITQSPIYSHFQETIQGATSIRAYGVVDRFIQTSGSNVDINNQAFYQYVVSNRFIGVAMQFIGNLITFFAAIFAVASRGTISAGLAGLSISNAMNITQLLEWAVRMLNNIETNIISVERIKEYSETKPEADWDIDATKPNPTWPAKGAVEISNFSVRYREGLELVLKDFNCKIQPEEKIGIVGRTGAGKSSLTLSLFRLVEAASGKIIIDGVDIGTLGLHQLRSRLTIIPQEPVLFTGTLRLNLDPFDDSSDAAIWAALAQAHLADYVKTLPDGLSHTIAEGGENLSVGQRQLVCLARALLRKTKILVLDEATAAVDLETDALIQDTIRTEFTDCTILTIAHRLNTIMDSSRILVLQEGRMVEFDSPAKLLADKSSVFFGMAKEAGLAN